MIIAHTLMNLDRLQDLKQKLMREPDFSNIWLFYMDEFADHPEFTDTGEAVANPFLDIGSSMLPFWLKAGLEG
jgi:hypothetical protein